ncbi:MAG: InlB B-repeat-containing protein [Lachnospiraceae bacterium]|nr:InlB B-repeat-containing protein [Lachnospiraceae bacterium]
MKNLLQRIFTAPLLAVLMVPVLSVSADEAEFEIIDEFEEVDPEPVSGYVPAPFEDDYEDVTLDLSEDSFQDIADSKYISSIAMEFPTRNQNPYGTCWAFASMAAAEMSAAEHHVMLPGDVPADASTDLSELHLAYFAGNGLEVYDPLGGMSGDYNGVRSTNNFLTNGGSVDNASHILASWTGTAAEDAYSYSAASGSYSTDRENSQDDVLHLKGFYTAKPKIDDNETEAEIMADRNAVKKLIVDYGMVTTSYYALKSGQSVTISGEKLYFSDLYSSSNNCYYMPRACSTNHAVSIVGWDDDFSADNYAYTVKPAGDGAWLIRNSWQAGVMLGEDGNPVGTDPSYSTYFWLSYYDKSLAKTSYAFDLDPVSRYDHNYQYDGAMTGVNVRGITKCSNIFTAKEEAEILDAVYFSTHSANIEYSIDVYKGASYGDPESGLHVVSSQKGSTTYPGGYTIKLDSPVYLNKDDIFSVVITLPQGAKIDIEYSVNGSYVTKAYTEPGRSMCLSNGVWKNTSELGQSGTTTYELGDARIKAFTITKDVGNYNLAAFDACGGAFDSGDTIKEVLYGAGEEYGPLPEPAREGYFFDGWYTDPEEGTAVTEETVSSGNVTYYAHWVKSAAVIFDANGGIIDPDAASVTEYYRTGSPYGTVPIPHRNGFVFDGWYTDIEDGDLITVYTEAAEDTSFFAHWLGTGEETAYELVYSDLGDGTICIDGYNKTAAGSLLIPASIGGKPVTVIGDGAFSGCTGLTGNLRIPDTVVSLGTAPFVGCSSLNGYLYIGKGIKTLGPGAFIDCPFKNVYITPEIGYIDLAAFNFGVNTLFNCVPGSYADSCIQEYGGTVVEWDGETLDDDIPEGSYRIKYVLDGGTNSDRNPFIYKPSAKSVRLYNAAKSGYKFSGWYYYKNTAFKKITQIPKNAAQEYTLYAVWSAPIKYSVTYNRNKGSLKGQTYPKTYTVEMADPELPVPVREGYVFDGWYTTKTFEGVPITKIKTSEARKITVYARWLYLFQYDPNADDATGTMDEVITAQSGKTVFLDKNRFERAGYAFCGWTTVPDGKGKIYKDGSAIKENPAPKAGATATFYAVWKGNPYSVIFDPNGGQGKMSPLKNRVYGKSFILTKNKYKNPGKTFKGWSTSKDGSGKNYSDQESVSDLTAKRNAVVTLYAQWE